MVELALLSLEVARRRSSGFGFERFVHAFVAAVLLGFAGFDEFGQDAETNPPGRERRESGEGVGGERGAVIGADPFGQAVFVEESREDGFGAGGRRWNAGPDSPGDSG